MRARNGSTCPESLYSCSRAGVCQPAQNFELKLEASMSEKPGSTYGFLLDTYETEILKIVTIWSAFPDSATDFRPSPKSRTVLEQMDHQIQSEGRWMPNMLGIDMGDPNP